MIHEIKVQIIKILKIHYTHLLCECMWVAVTGQHKVVSSLLPYRLLR